jgi:orotate phosphoribosyltransferase
MTEEEVLTELQRHNAVIRDTHVVYTSGRHGSTYINKDGLYPDVTTLAQLCGAMAAGFRDVSVDVTAGPAVGGVVLAHWTAHHLSSESHPVRAVYAERDPSGTFVFRRGYPEIIRARSVLVVEDVLTTGGSAHAVIEAVRLAGGNVVGLAAICDRGGIRLEDVGCPPRLVVLARVPLESWSERDCPLCAQGVPINVEVGKGREYLVSIARRGRGTA